MRLFLTIGLALLTSCAPVAGGASAIGFVYSGGDYRSDGAGVRGNATLFDGSTIETGEAPARVHLNNGVRIWLAPGTRATMSARGTRLAAGMGQFESPREYWLQARAVRVSFSQPDSTVRVALDDTGGAVVAPLKGAVEITNSHGVRVGQLEQGTTVRFAEAADPAAVSVSGCLYAKGGQFALTDTLTHIPMRLSGRGLEREAGHMVTVSGVQGSVAGRILNVSVTEVRRLGAECSGRGADGATEEFLAEARPTSGEGQLQAAGPRLNLLVVEGDGAINNIRQRTAREPIVEVQDENHKPVAGALVLFALPRDGASGTFPNGATTLSVTTDAQGRAMARGLKPNNVAGQFAIAVTASYAGLTAATTIRQTNAVAPAAGGSSSASGAAGTARTAAGLSTGAKAAIIGGVAATSVVGGLAAAGVFSSGSEPAVSR